MNVPAFARALMQETARRPYLIRLELLDQSASLIKARLTISMDTFVQVYRNDRFDTSKPVLIHNGERIYARDELDGIWHRHPADEPDSHDTSAEGRESATLSTFLDEVEAILAERELP